MKKLPFLLLILSIMTFTSCADSVKSSSNPLLSEWKAQFGIPPFDKIKAEHYKPALEEGMRLQLEDIDAIINNEEAPNFENTILALDNSGELYGSVSRVFSLINSAESSDAINEVMKEMSPLMAKHSDDIYLNESLYAKVKTVYESRNESNLDPLQIRLTEKMHLIFMRAGTHLNEENKTRLRKINEELSIADIEFSKNLQDATKGFIMVVEREDVENLPSNIKAAAKILAERNGHAEKYAFNTDKSSMLPFLTNSDREHLREKLYRGYIERCEAGSDFDNTNVINTILRLRNERARLLGYKTHADFMLEERMAKNPENVYALLNQMWEPALKLAKEELEAMQQIKERETGDGTFHSWDWWYYAEKVRKEKYSLDEEMIKPYFALESVRDGIFDLSNKLYGVTFVPIKNTPLYHKDCVVYEVLDKDNSHLAVLIMDFFPRDGKRVGAWCGSYRPRTFEGEKKIHDPIVTIVCNFTEPAGDDSALLTLDETETFFHEFGHALHTFFTNVPYVGLSRVERDFVELPSQIMENWAFEPKMLRNYAFHHSNNAPIPEHLITKINESAQFNMGFATIENIAAAFVDMDIHTIEEYYPMVLRDFETEALNNKRGLITQIEPRYRLPYFNHIFKSSYSAGYYSYIWSEVLDKDAYEAFTESGDIFNPTIAASFRDNILSKGGVLDGDELYRNFRGRDADRKPLLYSRGLLERPVIEPEDFLSSTLGEEPVELKKGDVVDAKPISVKQ